MRKILFILPLLFIACSTEEEEEEQLDITGTFYIESSTHDGQKVSLSDCVLEQHITLTKNDITITRTFETNDNVCSPSINTFSYTLNGSTIIINNEDPPAFGRVIRENVIELSTFYDVGTIKDIFIKD